MIDPENVSFAERIPAGIQESCLEAVCSLLEPGGHCVVSDCQEFEPCYIFMVERYGSLSERVSGRAEAMVEMLRVAKKD